MRLLTKQGFEKMEAELFSRCNVLSDHNSFYIKAYCSTGPKNFSDLIDVLKKNKVKYTAEKTTIVIAQSDIINKFLFETETRRAWVRSGGEIIDVSTMTHQQLSNCVGLLELLLTKGIITKESADEYITKLEENIMPELEERFKGEVLPYEAYYEWEKKLIEA